MSEPWVNAVIEVVVPLDGVYVSDDPITKQNAVGRALDRLIDALPEDMREFVLTGHWENAADDREAVS